MFKRKNCVKKIENDFTKKTAESYRSSMSDELSQLCKSSQFLREMELVMCECESPVSIPVTPINSKVTAVCPCNKKREETSPEIIVSSSTKWEKSTPDFSLSTESLSDSLLKNSYMTQEPVVVKNNYIQTQSQNKPQKSKLISLSLKKNNVNSDDRGTSMSKPIQKSDVGTQFTEIFNKTDPFQSDNDNKIKTSEYVSNCTIMKLMNSSDFLNPNNLIQPNRAVLKLDNPVQSSEYHKTINENLDIDSSIFNLMSSTEYKKQVNAGFDYLETSIIHDKSVANERTFGIPSNITLNDINWNESVAQSARYQPDSTNKSSSEDVNEIGPFYGLPEKVKHLIKQFKGIDSLYGK